MSRSKILEVAKAELGECEQPPNSNKNKYGKWYGFNGYAWCAMYVSWVYDQAGHPLGHIEDAKGYRSCQGGYRYWKGKGRLTTDPLPGDIVLFDWNGDGHADHTGIFEKWVVPGVSFMAYEGNTAFGNDSNGGMVMSRQRNAASVRAFVNPLSLDGAPVQYDQNLKKGDSGSRVRSLQLKLYDLGYTIVVDGDFGPGTEKVVKQFQKDAGVSQDGISTPLILGLLEDALLKKEAAKSKIIQGSYLRKGASGAAVVIMQKAINKKMGSGKVAEDGVFGKKTEEVLKQFQTQNHLDADGIAGPATFSALGISYI